MELNAEGLSGGQGRIQVEFIDGKGVLARSNWLAQRGVHLPVLWEQTGRSVEIPESGEARLRIQLEGRARLYSFGFRCTTVRFRSNCRRKLQAKRMTYMEQLAELFSGRFR